MAITRYKSGHGDAAVFLPGFAIWTPVIDMD